MMLGLKLGLGLGTQRAVTPPDDAKDKPKKPKKEKDK